MREWIIHLGADVITITTGVAMKQESQATTTGLSTLGLLGVVFVTLKLGHVIDWSWWWVTLPFWGGFGLFLVFVAVVLLMAFVIALIS
jgi:hypothetical protein